MTKIASDASRETRNATNDKRSKLAQKNKPDSRTKPHTSFFSEQDTVAPRGAKNHHLAARHPAGTPWLPPAAGVRGAVNGIWRVPVPPRSDMPHPLGMLGPSVSHLSDSDLTAGLTLGFTGFVMALMGLVYLTRRAFSRPPADTTQIL